jgi:Cu+-exporting ATPase
MERAVIMHDPEKISAEQISEIIEDRGFEAEVLATDLPTPRMSHASYDEHDVDDRQPPMMITTIGVEGMTCGACTSAVEGGFKDVAGVKHFSISLLAERAVIEHDPVLLSAEDIAEIIEDRGFGATIVETKEVAQDTKASSTNVAKPAAATTTVAVEGMTCGACTSAVEGGFKGVDGVLRFNISLLAERAIITHDPAKLSAEQIAEIIEDRGFGAKVLSTTFDLEHAGGSSSIAQFKVFGHLDAAAATALEEKLKGLPGISSAKLSLSTSRLTVTHQSNLTGMRAIVEVVEKEGYNALVADNDDNNAQLESLAKT